MKNLIIIASILFTLVSCQPKEVVKENAGSDSVKIQRDTTYTLENSQLKLSVDAFGGAYTGLELKSNPVNVFSWTLKRNQMPETNKNGALFHGHFLCFGRWGGATAGEKQNGTPVNGETNNLWWEILKNQQNELQMEATSNLDMLKVKRTIVLGNDASIYAVKEEFTNLASFARISNFVQHATLGTPFVDSTLLVDCNAGKGFLQDLAKEGLTTYEYTWNNGYADKNKTKLDLRKSEKKEGYVSTHIFADGIEWGWITAYNPNTKLLVGFVFRTSEYPWLHVWHGMLEGKNWSKGLEFGTTGLGDTFAYDERTAMNFYGRKNFQYLDAKETISKSFYTFIIPVSEPISGVKQVLVADQSITVLSLPTGKEIFKTKLPNF